MIPGDDPEVEMIETRPVTPVDVFVEPSGDGLVLLTFSADDSDEDVEVGLRPEQARELGEALFRLGCS